MPNRMIDTPLWVSLDREIRRVVPAITGGGDMEAFRPFIEDFGSIVLAYSPAARDQILFDIATGAPATAIVLGRRRLLNFLAVKALEPDEISRVFDIASGLGGPSAREKLSLIRAVASLVASLAPSVGSPDPSATDFDAETVIYLLGELARRRYNIDGRIDIEGMLRSFARVEPALYFWRTGYRDHLLHAADVCLLGWLLLDSRVVGPGRTRDTLASRIGGMLGMSKECVYANWFLASLLHDVGYAVEAIRQAAERIAYLKSSYMEAMQDQIREALSRTAVEIQESVLQQLNGSDFKGLDHGVIGFLNLSDTLDTVIQDPDRRRKFEPACQAILKHNLYVPVSFQEEPIAALLILCDELQEWDRPRVSGSRLAAATRQLTARSARVPIPSADILESLELRGLELQNGGFTFTADPLECVLTYRPPMIGRFYPQRVCVEKSHNIQRLDPSGMPFRLRLTIVSQYIVPPSIREYGLEALRSYALIRPDAGLIEFTEGRSDGVQVIEFEEPYRDVQMLSFDVEALNKFPPLPKRLDVDWDDFARWSMSRPDPYALEEEPLLREDGL